MRTFQFSDAKSHKFWAIDVQGKSFTVTFGKVGTAGQSQTKTFATEEKAAAEQQAAAEQRWKDRVAAQEAAKQAAAERAAAQRADQAAQRQAAEQAAAEAFMGREGFGPLPPSSPTSATGNEP